MVKAFRVTGRVQGVGFRWFTRETAFALGLRGTVRNARDGAVEVVADGASGALDELERRLRRGPGAAVVEAVEEIPPPTGELPADFRILR
jgi:acylphosphatase